MPDKTPHADRAHGGPGSSQQDARHPEKGHEPGPGGRTPGTPTNPDRNRVSGGGGEHDRHHTHPSERQH